MSLFTFVLAVTMEGSMITWKQEALTRQTRIADLPI